MPKTELDFFPVVNFKLLQPHGEDSSLEFLTDLFLL